MDHIFVLGEKGRMGPPTAVEPADELGGGREGRFDGWGMYIDDRNTDPGMEIETVVGDSGLTSLMNR